VFAVEVSGARGEDDLVAVYNNIFAPRGGESDFDIRACRRIVEPARLGVNNTLYKDICAGRCSLLESSHVAGTDSLAVERHGIGRTRGECCGPEIRLQSVQVGHKHKRSECQATN
jgi:hypothetical protein